MSDTLKANSRIWEKQAIDNQQAARKAVENMNPVKRKKVGEARQNVRLHLKDIEEGRRAAPDSGKVKDYQKNYKYQEKYTPKEVKRVSRF